MIFIKKYEEIPINNLFINEKMEKIGYINQKGNLYYLNNKEKAAKYGTLDIKKNNMFYYHENGLKWAISTPIRSFISSDGYCLKKPNSSLLYNDFNDSFFQIYRNGDILQDGKEINVTVDKNQLWTSASIHNEHYILYINEQNEFYIHHLRADYKMFNSQYDNKYVAQEINVSKNGIFINVYIFYANHGVRVLRFFGGFNNFLADFFITVPACRDFSSSYPYLCVLQEDGEVKIWNMQHNGGYEMMYSKTFPDLKDGIEQMVQWEKVIYMKKKSELFQFLLLPM